MRICILGQYPPQLGGIASHCKKLTGKLVERGHQVSVITYGKMGRKEKKIKIYET